MDLRLRPDVHTLGGLVQYHAVLPAILRYVGDTQADGVGGRADAHNPAAEQNLSRIARREAKDGFGQLSAPRAHQPRQAEDLPAPHLETDVAHARLSGSNAAQP